MKPMTERILDRVQMDPNGGCWFWEGGIKGGGYGAIRDNGGTSAHRASYKAFIGPVPEGMVVCHRCDVKLCVNPDHLWIGTQSANMVDMVRKRRGNSVNLTESEVLSMRAEYDAGGVGRDIARRSRVPLSTAMKAITRKTWRHLP